MVCASWGKNWMNIITAEMCFASSFGAGCLEFGWEDCVDIFWLFVWFEVVLMGSSDVGL